MLAHNGFRMSRDHAGRLMKQLKLSSCQSGKHKKQECSAGAHTPAESSEAPVRGAKARLPLPAIFNSARSSAKAAYVTIETPMLGLPKNAITSLNCPTIIPVSSVMLSKSIPRDVSSGAEFSRTKGENTASSDSALPHTPTPFTGCPLAYR